MARFPVTANQVQITTTTAASDIVQNGVLLENTFASARMLSTGGTQTQNGLKLTPSSQVVYLDATAGLPAGVQWLNGLPFSQAGELCVSSGAVFTWRDGIPFAANGAVSTNGAADPAVIAYVASVVSAGGTIPAGEQAALNAFVLGAKADGIWTKLTELCTWQGGTLASAVVKLKALGAANCVLNSFVLGDLTAAGLVGDGVNKWVNTQTTVNQATASGPMGMGVFVTQECTQTTFGNLMGTNAGGNPQVVLRWNANGANQLEGMLNGLGATSAFVTKVRQVIPIGLAATQRVVNQLTLYQGGLPQSDTGSAFTYAGSATSLGVFSGDGGGNKVACTLGMYFISDGTMTATDHRNLAKRANALMVGLGRIVPDVRNMNYVPIIGQSLAVGSTGSPPLSTTQPYKNITIESGYQGNLNLTTPSYWSAASGCGAGGLMPMIELSTETIASGMANTVSMYARTDGLGVAQDMLTQNFGLGATAYAGLAKGTSPYQDNIDTSTFTPVAAPLYATRPMLVRAVAVVHGESDMMNGSYGLNIRQWQIDYETDYKAITGQTGTIPMFHSQPSCWTDPTNVNSATGVSPYQILSESKLNPTKTLLVCPKYFLPYTAASIHLTNAGYRWLGEYYAKAYYQHVVKGIQWTPLQISNVQRTGAVITLTVSGNVGNLQFDTVNVTDPSGASNTKGFEYTDSAGGGVYARISSVVLQGANQIVITLTADPSGNTNRQIAYAYTGTAGNNPGPTTGPRGNVKDSDPAVGKSTTPLFNWLVHDIQPVP